ncbi:hypothetical protein BJ875DRAFT_539936 [Amylocarpus encephaloides]|uniref:Uncharacterized protein n=1 Tax=Amylocarpus encephaloides TaxID=45428 RepID=A0A9P7YQX8_9HELO|nr:hypothetical protein BJ875DRAFT_539936 [Amylocarpus encephaloides]
MIPSEPRPADLPLPPRTIRCPRCPHRVADLSSHVSEADAENSNIPISAEMCPGSRMSSTNSTSPVAPPAPVNSPHLPTQGGPSTRPEPIPAYIEKNSLESSLSDVADDGCSSTQTEEIEKDGSLSLESGEKSHAKYSKLVSDVAEASTMADDDGSSTTNIEDIEKPDYLDPILADGTQRTTLNAGPCIETDGDTEEVPCTTENLKYLTRQLGKLTLRTEQTLASFKGAESDVEDDTHPFSDNTGKDQDLNQGAAQNTVATEIEDAPQHAINGANDSVKCPCTDAVVRWDGDVGEARQFVKNHFSKARKYGWRDEVQWKSANIFSKESVS